MNERLRTAFREAAESAPVLGDPVAARRSASRRSTTRRTIGGIATAVSVGLLWVGGSHLVDRADRQPSHPVPPSPRTSAAGLDRPVLYRSCSDGCRVGILDDGFSIQLRPRLSDDLAVRGVDDVSLSPDGLFVAIPHDGALTITHVYSQPEFSVTVPAGPSSSQWLPAFWSRGEAYLEIAEWTGDTVTAVGVVDLAFDESTGGVVGAGSPGVHTRTVDADRHLVPVEMGAGIDNLVGLAEAGTDPRTYALHYVRVGPSIYTGKSEGLRVSWATCLGPDESLLGPDGARTTYTVAKDTSSDQRTATVVYRAPDQVPIAVVNSGSRCSSAGSDRYDLPTSSSAVAWHLLGPLDHTTSLMTRDEGNGVLELVEVSASGRRVVGHVPADSEVVAAGMTGGFFD